MKAVVGMLKLASCILLSLLFAISAILIVPFDRTGKAFHWNASVWAKLVLLTCGVKVHAVGLEHVDVSKTYVFVSNHASAFDIPSVLYGLPLQIRLVYKKELERIPFFGWGLKIGSFIGIDRRKGVDAMKSLEEAAGKIRTGASVLLFAEGTRTLDGKLQPFKRGAFNLAVKAGVPVVPLTINGSYHLLRKGSFAIRKGTVTLVLEKPIHLSSNGGKKGEMALMSDVHQAIQNHYRDQ